MLELEFETLSLDEVQGVSGAGGDTDVGIGPIYEMPRRRGLPDRGIDPIPAPPRTIFPGK